MGLSTQDNKGSPQTSREFFFFTPSLPPRASTRPETRILVLLVSILVASLLVTSDRRALIGPSQWAVNRKSASLPSPTGGGGGCSFGKNRKAGRNDRKREQRRIPRKSRWSRVSPDLSPTSSPMARRPLPWGTSFTGSRTSLEPLVEQYKRSRLRKLSQRSTVAPGGPTKAL